MDCITQKDLIDLKEDLLKEIRKLAFKKIPEKKWLRTNEVQKLLSISWSTLQRMRIKGQLPYTKIENTYFYSVEEIHKILQERMSTNTTTTLL